MHDIYIQLSTSSDRFKNVCVTEEYFICGREPLCTSFKSRLTYATSTGKVKTFLQNHESIFRTVYIYNPSAYITI